MITKFVEKKSDLTRLAARCYFTQHYRTRLNCNCKTGENRRNGILIARGCVILVKLIKCKRCAKEVNHAK
jgi:hypothetical protein